MTAVFSNRVWLKGCDGDDVVRPAVIHFEGQTIHAVDFATSAPKDTIDFGDDLITPAFVNAHTHLALNFLRGFDGLMASADANLVENLFFHLETNLNEEDVLLFAKLGAYESLLHGVGMVWDHYYHPHAVVQALGETGLSGVVAPTLQDIQGPGTGEMRGNLDFTLDGDLRRDLSTKNVFLALGPHATDTVSSSLWESIREASLANRLPIHAHLAQSFEEVERAHQRHQLSPFRYLESLGVLDADALFAHGIFVSQDELQALNAQKHTLAFCPYSQAVFAFPANLRQWQDANVSWCVATDCAASNDSMNPLKELRFIAASGSLRTTLSESQHDFFANGTLEDARALWQARQAPSWDQADLLDSIWQRPGKIHPDFRAGVIEVGALANLVVWSASHPTLWPDPSKSLLKCDPSGAIAAMWVGGREIGERGDFYRSVVDSDSYRDTCERANLARKKLFARSGLT